MITRDELEKMLGTEVQDLSIYQTAFVHKSSLGNSNDSSDEGEDNNTPTEQHTESYERLEFLGDSLIGFVVARYLYDKFPEKREGFLTKLRTKLVSSNCLASFAKHLQIQKHVVMNQKAMKNGWNNNDRILEDVFESLVGALLIDRGVLAAKKFFLNMVETYVDFDVIMNDNNFKDILMRYTQALAIPLPEYKTIERKGEYNKKIFEIHVYVNNIPRGCGTGMNKKVAEQSAAKQALISIGHLDIKNPSVIT